MKNEPVFHSLLQGTENTRDLGSYQTSVGQTTARFRFLRSDLPKMLTVHDRFFLDSHHITTVLDLRSRDEIDNAPDPFGNLPGMKYIQCCMEEGSRIPASVEDVPAVYRKISQSQGMQKALLQISAAESGVLFHCTAGKDRTGVLAAILLLTAGVRDEDIIADYALSFAGCARLLAGLAQKYPSLDPGIVTPTPDKMQTFLEQFHAEYTDVRFYYEANGLSGSDSDTIRKKMLNMEG